MLNVILVNTNKQLNDNNKKDTTNKRIEFLKTLKFVNDSSVNTIKSAIKGALVLERINVNNVRANKKNNIF